LQLVNQERQLPGDATNRLLASMKLIDLEFTRSESLQSFRVTARIGTERISVEGSFDNPLEAIHKLAEQLLEDTVREESVTDAAPQAEAARFAAEALFFDRLGLDYAEDALEKIESAVALNPESLEHRNLLVHLLTRRLYVLTNNRERKFSYDNDLLVARLDAETMQRAVQDVLRREALRNTFPPGYPVAGANYFPDPSRTVFPISRTRSFGAQGNDAGTPSSWF
jgi:hypothetical protein